ncbi:MAG: DegT/DnrJ/EryC1/StrS family aminotransferase [Candidatus Omnitrophica bacterium]|nr:DegT/DnrJ/EryC1/StrS family aminotransferase [Candidatus Omnitrophota bacterium]
MTVPFIDFREQYLAIKDKVDSGLAGVFERGAFILGQEEKDFERDFAAYCNVKYGSGVNSGTDALYLALSALDIKPGDEVILPSFTFIATALCVSYVGAKPVFVDVDETTYNMNPERFQAAITPRTKAVIVVHLYGQSADMTEIAAIARQHHIKIVEDAAQAHGATYQGEKIGSLGDVACFSFYPTKSLGAFGDGGMVVTDDEKIHEGVQMLRDYGRKGRYEHVIKGHNSRLDTVQAVVLNAKLPLLDSWNEQRRNVAAHYAEFLQGVNGLVIPAVRADRTHVYQTYALRIKKNRDKIVEEMKNKGIGVLIHYPIPIHLQEAYAECGYKRGDLPVSEKLAEEVLSLPMFPHMKKDQVGYVAAALKALI